MAARKKSELPITKEFRLTLLGAKTNLEGKIIRYTKCQCIHCNTIISLNKEQKFNHLKKCPKATQVIKTKYNSSGRIAGGEQSKLNVKRIPALTKVEKETFQEKIRLWATICDVSFAALEHPLLKDALALLRPNIPTIDRIETSNWAIKKKKQIQKGNETLLKNVTQLELSVDGTSDQNKDGLSNYFAFADNGTSILLDTVYSDSAQTAEVIHNNLMKQVEYVRQFAECNSTVFDTEAKMKRVNWWYHRFFLSE